MSRFTENVAVVLIALAAVSLIIGVFESFELSAMRDFYNSNASFTAGVVLFVLFGVAGSFFAGLRRH